MSRPQIVFVDDESNNTTVFEAALPESWEIKTFTSPLAALDALPHLNPWIIASDQRMPGMMGVNFLEIARRVCPDAVRVLVTGFSEENLVIEAVRKARVADYIRKPWGVDDLVFRLEKLCESYKLEMDLKEKKNKLENQNKELQQTYEELSSLKDREVNLRKELESWAPPFLLNLLTQKDLQFPARKDLAVITFDLIDSSALHDVVGVDNRPIRKHVLEIFSTAIIRHGGWRESSAGDSAYAHFGLVRNVESPVDAAFAAASEFRMMLRNLCTQHNVSVECGIGLHFAQNCLVDLHSTSLKVGQEEIIQKHFDSASPEIDLVHRMEKIVHTLPGSNVIFSKAFLDRLKTVPFNVRQLGYYLFKGQTQPVMLYLKSSDLATPEQINNFAKMFSAEPQTKAAA